MTGKSLKKRDGKPQGPQEACHPQPWRPLESSTRRGTATVAISTGDAPMMLHWVKGLVKSRWPTMIEAKQKGSLETLQKDPIFSNFPCPSWEFASTCRGNSCLVWWWGSWLITMAILYALIDFSHITRYYNTFVTTPYSQLSAWIFKKNHKESSKTIWDFRMTSIVPVPTSKLSIFQRFPGSGRPSHESSGSQ